MAESIIQQCHILYCFSQR